MKIFIIALTVGALLALGIIVIDGAMKPDCEALYNEYMSTVDISTRDALFSQGIDNGCFHYN